MTGIDIFGVAMVLGMFLMSILMLGGGIYITQDSKDNSWWFKAGVMLTTLSITAVVWGACIAILIDIFIGAPQ